MSKISLCCLFIAVAAALTGCYQFNSEADDLRTVPVTNNPNIIPSGGGSKMTSAPM